MFPSGLIPAYKSGLPGAGPDNPWPFAAIVQRIRSFSLSIGQLTFASFMLLLAMIVMTSVASVVSIRHIDATFAELQRLAERRRSGGGDRPAHERVAAGGARFRHRSGGAVQSGLGGGVVVERAVEEDPARACARAAGDDRRRHAAAGELPRWNRARHRLDRAPRRTDRSIAAGARAVRSRRSPGCPTGPPPETCSRRKTRSPRRCWRTIPRPPSGPRRRMRALAIDDPALRSAADAYADAIISISGTEGQIAELDKEVLGTEGRQDRPRHRFVARPQRAAGARAGQRFRQNACPR